MGGWVTDPPVRRPDRGLPVERTRTTGRPVRSTGLSEKGRVQSYFVLGASTSDPAPPVPSASDPLVLSEGVEAGVREGVRRRRGKVSGPLRRPINSSVGGAAPTGAAGGWRTRQPVVGSSRPTRPARPPS